MGILNVTPDSFSDGGAGMDPDVAVARGHALFDEGAAIVDIGGESTRPGAAPVGHDEECRRVLPVVSELARRGRVSIDTRKRTVAEAAIEAGATLVNDVSGSLYPVAAEAGVGWVAMHSPGAAARETLPETAAGLAALHERVEYADVVGEVLTFCTTRAAAARDAGVAEVYVDPGLGFGKDAAENLRLLHHLERFVASGFPVLVGASRKRFVGHITAFRGEEPPASDRRDGSLAVTTWAVSSGAAIVRVHDVAAAVAACRLVHEQVEVA
jgi:dihydropteroate synthase